jgi:lon-related putative ATP-dependent protease
MAKAKRPRSARAGRTSKSRAQSVTDLAPEPQEPGSTVETSQSHGTPNEAPLDPGPLATHTCGLPWSELRWSCPEDALTFDTTEHVEPTQGVIGQEDALEALRFGLETTAPGQNIFVRGLTGTGRMTLLRRTMEEIKPACPAAQDRCYVHNFTEPDRPRLISLPRGSAHKFRRHVDELADFIRDDLNAALSSEALLAQRKALAEQAQQEMHERQEPFEEALKNAGLALVTLQMQNATQVALFPLVEGKPIPPEEFEQAHEQGAVSDEQFAAYKEQRDKFAEQLQEIAKHALEVRRRHNDAVRNLLKQETVTQIGGYVREIEQAYPSPAVRKFLGEIVNDLANERLTDLEGEEDFTYYYRVNVLLAHTDHECPIVIENTPTVRRLLGTIDHTFEGGEGVATDHMMIRAGSLLRADGGFLILEARDVLTEPHSWKILLRTLRSGRLEITQPETSHPLYGGTLKPEPIDINVKIVLLGDSETYYLLDQFDAEFPHLFKVLADFDHVIPRDAEGVQAYAGVFARIAKEEELPPFDRASVASLVEYGARIAAQKDRLTTRFGRLADLAREAAFIARKEHRQTVGAEEVRNAVRRARRRADLPSRRFRQYIEEGTIRIATSGSAVGQINGLAVLHAGPLTYGFPARITATIGPGSAGVINIEREAALSGAIHTKGFYILGGLLRYLLRTDHPLAFDASIAFEQSYGGIDGDSASGAEICCLLSALTNVPLRQDIAMTGAIDQVGNILAIGAVTEKIEGFFDVCVDAGLTGTQGVVIPRANAGDLMLRESVMEACREGRFQIWAVQTVHEALEIFTGMHAGKADFHGVYAPGTLLYCAVERAKEYWLKATRPRVTKG